MKFNWNPKKVLHTQKMATCTVMEHARSVLHLFPSCVALENKLETVNETRNRTVAARFLRQFYTTFVRLLKKVVVWSLVLRLCLMNIIDGALGTINNIG